jgi:hypothetical protein
VTGRELPHLKFYGKPNPAPYRLMEGLLLQQARLLQSCCGTSSCERCCTSCFACCRPPRCWMLLLRQARLLGLLDGSSAPASGSETAADEAAAAVDTSPEALDAERPAQPLPFSSVSSCPMTAAVQLVQCAAVLRCKHAHCSDMPASSRTAVHMSTGTAIIGASCTADCGLPCAELLLMPVICCVPCCCRCLQWATTRQQMCAAPIGLGRPGCPAWCDPHS